jgi:putative transposase
MASENPMWGEERIVNELLVKLGIRVSPRTVGKYMPKRPPCKRRLAHVGVTNYPTADWTLPQLREVVGDESTHHRYLIHDRDGIFARHLDNSVRALGLKVSRTPFRSLRANSICERVIGTIRRECLDRMIPVSETHLRTTLREWVRHYNAGRPHKSLGPGVPDPPKVASAVPKSESRYRMAAGTVVLAQSVLGGLHHEYSLAPGAI